MQFFNLDQSLTGPFDFEAREAITGKKVAVAISGVALAAALGAAGLGIGPAVLDYGVAIFAMLLNAGAISMVRHAGRPTNWLLRVAGDRIQIKFRTYMNDHFPAEEIQIVELQRSEVAWLRDVRAGFVVDAPRGPHQRIGRTEITRQYLEIGLANADLGDLDHLLRAERTHPSVGKGGWKSKYNFNPVQTAGSRAVRVCWRDPNSQITPKLGIALDFFSRWAEVRTAHCESVNCTAGMLKDLPTEEQDAVMRQTAPVDSMAVEQTMCALRGCSLTEATRLVEAL
jgi:hypothetical protein